MVFKVPFCYNNSMTMTNEVIGPQSAMREVLAAFPGAQRALFRRYHIGGCSQCGFGPGETVEQICRRNSGLDPTEVLEHIRSSHEQDEKILIEPKALADWLKQDKSILLLDVRSREEYEAVHLKGSMLMSQPVMQQIMAEGTNSRPLVIVDHQGGQGLDGHEATRKIRAIEAEAGERRTPIIALTANAFVEDRETCLAAGMDDFLVKPLHRERLADLLAALPAPRPAHLAA